MLGDLAEARSSREAFELLVAVIRVRLDLFGSYRGTGSLQDFKLALRMLFKYPGLTIAGGLALAIAIGLGAAWYDIVQQLFYPKIPLRDGDRIVHVEMANARSRAIESRLLHDFAEWKRHARSFEALAAYRTIEQPLFAPNTAPESAIVAETTASAFTVAQVAPLLGRPLLDADEQPGAPAVVVIGHRLWQRQFGGRSDIVGSAAQLGKRSVTIVGVMPEGFRFPEKHTAWTALELRGYGALDGPRVVVFGRLVPGVTVQQATAELAGFSTHEELKPRVGPYGAPSLGDHAWLSFSLTHLPILLVLAVACGNVGTLVYARTATRDSEITMRYALGATRGRIITQLFAEALALAAVAALAGLFVANWLIKLVADIFTSGRPDVLPFWITSSLRFPTVVYGAGLTVVTAVIFGVLPALRATGSNAQAQLRNLGSGGATLRFGKVWTAVMIGQVGLTVIGLPLGIEFVFEALRDHTLKQRFPAGRYLALHVAPTFEETDADAVTRWNRSLSELAHRLESEPGVLSVTSAMALPGTYDDVGSAEIESSLGAAPIHVPVLWTNVIGRGYFEAFEVPLLAGRPFEEGDYASATRTVIVNEAFARRLLDGASPVGRRVRFAGRDAAKPEPWLEIVGVVRDIGMTPTSHGEAPYVFRPATPSVAPLRIGLRVAGDPAALVPAVRRIAVDFGRDVHLAAVEPLDDVLWRNALPNLVLAGAATLVMALALFLSAFGIYSLMSVSVSRRTREIGLRTALGASRARVVMHIFKHALLIVGGGVGTGVGGILLFAAVYMTYVEPLKLRGVASAVLLTSSVMFAVGLLACVEPIRRALRVQPADALKEC